MVHVFRVLGGNNYVFNMRGTPVFVIGHSHLGLAVRTQPVHMPAFATETGNKVRKLGIPKVL